MIEVRELMMSVYTIFTDGGSRAGYEAACAAHLTGPDFQLTIGQYLGHATNNEAEWSGLILALETARSFGLKNLKIHADSQLVVNQFQGKWKISKAELLPYKAKADSLSSRLVSMSIQWVPREENKIADAAVNQVLDNKAEYPTWKPLS